MLELQRIPLELYKNTFSLYSNGRYLHVAEDDRTPEYFLVPKTKNPEFAEASRFTGYVTFRLGSLPLRSKDDATNSPIVMYFNYDLDTLYLDIPPEGCFDASSFLLLQQAIPADGLAMIRNFTFDFYSPWSEMGTSSEGFAKQLRHFPDIFVPGVN